MRRHDKIALVSNDDAIATRGRDSIYIRNFCSLTANKRQATCIIRVVNSQSRGQRRERDAFLRLLFAHSGELASPLVCNRPSCSLTPILNALLIRITFPQIEQNEKTDHRSVHTESVVEYRPSTRDTCVKHGKFREENNLC